MPRPRKRLVSLNDTPYYHCISRCVRRAFLCGVDRHSGCSFEHRRQWIVDRILLLSTVFTIDVCAYAAMSNHYHVVLHVDANQGKRLSPSEVARRWLKLFSGPPLVREWLDGGLLGDSDQRQVEQWLATVRNEKPVNHNFPTTQTENYHGYIGACDGLERPVDWCFCLLWPLKVLHWLS